MAAAIAAIPCVAGSVASQTIPAEIAQVLAPAGRLRAAINYGNPVLAQPGATGPGGVSVELARDLGLRLGREVAFVIYDGAGRVTDAVSAGEWDVAFLAVDPVRGREIDYTAPYVIIEGTYLVPNASSFRAVADVDRAGIKVGVSAKSAYDLYLTRELKAATLVRFESAKAGLDALRAGQLDVLAGVRQQIEMFAGEAAGLRVMPGRFMRIEQAVAIPKGREAALPALRDFVENAKASGFVARALAASGQGHASVAPVSR